MKYHVAFFFFVAVFIISTATMFLIPLRSEVSDYRPLTSNENAGQIPDDEHASTKMDETPTGEDASANTNVRPGKEEYVRKQTDRRKSGKTNRNKRFPETKPATPTPTLTPSVSSEVAGLNYINVTCTIISAIGAVLSVILGYRQDRRNKS